MLAFLGTFAFVGALFAAARWLPGPSVGGREEPDGTRFAYRLNGLACFAAVHAVVFLGTALWGLSLAPLLEHFWALFAAANVLACAGAVWLDAAGRRRRAARGEPPAGWRQRLVGLELNPRLAGVDLKMFAYEPSLLGFGLLVAAFGYAQWERHGLLTPQMVLWLGGWWLYLASHYRRQAFLLGIWDVIAEPFGLMLLWGDFVLVPFFYCIGGWWLVDATDPLPAPALLGIAALYSVGLWMFRGANAQKWRFKQDPRARIWGRPAEALDGRLLVSGWWGLGRHLNYTGEIAVYLALTLCTGFQSWVPYLLPLWMLVLLAHRAERDDRRCRAKYGPLWERYCARARFRMLPGVY